MNQTQLNPSPLEILYHHFVKIELNASEAPHPEGRINIKCNRNVDYDDGSLEGKLLLEVLIEPIEPEKAIAYTGSVAVQGRFRLHASFPKEKRNLLMEVTAPSILYGSAREMLMNLTARGPHGILTLPSISFQKILKDSKVTA
jgi:preprotein translocase subunit SecB